MFRVAPAVSISFFRSSKPHLPFIRNEDYSIDSDNILSTHFLNNSYRFIRTKDLSTPHAITIKHQS